MKFKELPLHEDVIQGIEAAGFTDCMPVQEKVLPGALQGKDVMVQSKTGSGKTAVFILAVLQKFVDTREQVKHLSAEEAFSVKAPVALIIAPTRELAVQIEEDAKMLSSGIPDFRIGCFYGGVGYAKQDKHISDGLDLIIGTPGRILDYQKMGKIDFKLFDTFVIDEADRLFDMGFYPDIQKMFKYMVKNEKRQTMLFSATLSTRVRNLAWDYMNSPLEFEVQPEEITVKAITQELYHVSKDEKFSLFLRLMAKENPQNALIFTNTKAKAVEISKRLNVNGYKTQYLMGDLPQSKRLQVINRMKNGELRFLIATDVAARGLQIDDLELVVNYDIPEDYESYVHRIGRTARAGKSGKAITLACEQFVYGLEAIENYIQMKVPVVWADEESVPPVEDKSAHMRFRDLVSEAEYASRGDGRRSPGGRPSKGPGRAKRGGPSAGKESSRPPRKRGGKPPVAAKSVKPSPEPPKSATQKSAPQKGGPQKPAQQRSNRNRPPARKGKSYQEIQKMDFEERIAYYKQVYAGDEAQSTRESRSNAPAKSEHTGQRKGTRQPQKSQKPRQPRSKSPDSGKQDVKQTQTKQKTAKQQDTTVRKSREHQSNRVKPSQQKPKSSPDVQSAPQKKQGLLARLFKRNKGNA